MTLLLSKVRRDLVTRATRSLGITCLVAIAVAVVAGSDRAGAMISESLPAWREDLAAADLEVRFPLSPRAVVLEGLQDPPVPGIAAYETRLVIPALLTRKDGGALAALLRPLPRPGEGSVNRLRLLTGRIPAGGERALVVDRSLASVHELRVGEDVVVQVGEARLALPVVGVVLSPEHLLTPIHPEVPLAAPGSLAPLFLTAAAYRAVVPTDRVNSLSVRLAPEADPDAVRTALLAALRVPVSEVLPAARLPDARMAELAAAPFHVYMPTIYFAHVCLSVLLLVIALTRGVEQDRRQMGVLLALGHRPAGIVASLLVRALVPVVLGATLGTLAQGPYAHALYESYGGALGFPPPPDPGPTQAVAILWGGGIVVATLACLISALAAVSRPVSSLLRPYWRADARRGPGQRRRTARRAGDRLGIPFSIRLGLLNALRRRRATIGAVVGLGGNFAVLIAFTFLHVTHDRVAHDAVSLWNPGATVHFASPVPLTDLQALEAGAAGEVEGGVSRAAFFAGPTRRSWWRVIGVEPSGRGRALHLTQGRRLGDGAAPEILLDPRVARDLGVALGSTVTVFASADSPEGLDLEVVGILDGVSLGLGVIGLETAQLLFALPVQATIAFITSSLPDDRLTSLLQEAPAAHAVMTRGEALHLVRSQFGRSDVILVWGLVLSAIVAALFLAILAVLDATDWRPELATLQALGWKNGAVASACLTEIVGRGLAALALATLAAPWLAELLLARLADVNEYRIALQAPLWVPLLLSIAALAFMPLGAMPMLLALRRASPGAVLRGAGEE